MDKNKSIYIEMYIRALDAAIREWTGLSERFRDLDSKAQATATVAGVFIAAVFAFTPMKLQDSCLYLFWLLVVDLFFLASSIALCVFAMKIRWFRKPPGGAYALQIINDISVAVESGRDIDEMHSKFYVQQAVMWQEGITEIRRHNLIKARLIEISQWLVVVAIFFVITVAIFKMAAF